MYKEIETEIIQPEKKMPRESTKEGKKKKT
jgi:hypothetical protein